MRNLCVDDLEIHQEESLQSISIKENWNLKKIKLEFFIHEKFSNIKKGSKFFKSILKI